MVMKTRGTSSLADVERKLNALARQCALAEDCFEESRAEAMNEFDALKWKNLIAQRKVLIQQAEDRNPIPLIFARVSKNIFLENRADIKAGLEKLAA